MQRSLVTGANRGIGLELVGQLLRRGDRVFAACRSPGKALKLTELAGAHPGRLSVLPLDLNKERSIAELAREVAALTDALDLLVNNAGVLVSGERYGELSAKTVNDTVATNATGSLLVAQALTPLLARSDDARIVNITSELGSLAATTVFQTPSYAISKAALNMVTRLLAAQLGESGIRVISVNPGWVKTDMGGARAPVAVQASVDGIIKLADGLQRGDNGRFFDFGGEELPW